MNFDIFWQQQIKMCVLWNFSDCFSHYILGSEIGNLHRKAGKGIMRKKLRRYEKLHYLFLVEALTLILEHYINSLVKICAGVHHLS